MDIKVEIKEEPYIVDFCSENEREFSTNDLISNVKIETSDSDIKPELEEDSPCYSPHHLIGFNETIKESEIETRVDIKEQNWWLEGTSYVHDDIKDETHEGFYSTKPPSECEECVSSYTPDLGIDVIFNMKKDGPECERDSKYQSQKGLVTEIPSIETSVGSENHDKGKIVIMASCLEQSKLVQQSKSNKQDINKKNSRSMLGHDYRKSYKRDVSEKCSKCLSHLEKYRLPVHSKEASKQDVWDKDLNHLSLNTQKLTDDGRNTQERNICNTDFTGSLSLKQKKLIQEGINLHQCNICNKAFTKLSGLNRHKLIHQVIKPHKCSICDKAFATLAYLEKHKLIHEGIKPHKCNICIKAFTHLQSLIRHKLIHKGIKPHKLIQDGIMPHKCDICSKTFSTLSSLKRHKLIHEGIKPYKCIICNKAFTELSSLKEHKFIHAAIKPYKCGTCNKTFTRLSRLKMHKFIHEGIMPHKCNLCRRTFTHLSSLKRHINSQGH